MTHNLAAVLRDLAAGSHTIRVKLANNDHSAPSDGVVDEVTVTVVGLKAAMTLVTPAANAIIYGNSTAVTVTVTNFTLAPTKVGQANVNGEGHWHVLVDGVYKGFSATLSTTIEGLSVGDHVVRVELHNNDHGALGVEVSARVTVHVAALPSIRIVTPTNGANITGTTLDLTVQIVNFTMVAVGSTSVNAAGAGHWHLFLDGTLVTMLTATNFTLTNLTVGKHTIRVELSENDHSPIMAGTNASTITTSVSAPAAPPTPGFLPGFEALGVLAAVVAVAAIALGRRRKGT